MTPYKIHILVRRLVKPINTSYLTNSYIIFTLKIEFVSKIMCNFWPKNDDVLREIKNSVTKKNNQGGNRM